MRVDEYTFGRISIDGVAYAHDVVIEGGTIRRRKKRPSKPRREELGHTPLTPEERVRWRAKHLWVGTGARARLPVPDDFCEEARRRGVELLTKTTPELVKMINEAFPADTNVILHVHLLIREARSLRRGSRTRRHPRLNQNLDAGSAGGRVGCESASQFSREYSRRFGAPPQRDIKRMRLIWGATYSSPRFQARGSAPSRRKQPPTTSTERPGSRGSAMYELAAVARVATSL